MILPYKIAIAAAFVIAVFGYGYHIGHGVCKSSQMKQTIKTVEKVRYVRQKADAMPSGAVYDGLLRWQRD